MVDIEKLTQATPVRGLAADPVAWVYGLPSTTPSHPPNDPAFAIFEPPVARKIPFVDAVPFLRTLLVGQRVDLREAGIKANVVWFELRPRLDVFDRALRLDEGHPASAFEGCPLAILLDVAREKRLASPVALGYWERILATVEEARLYPPAERSMSFDTPAEGSGEGRRLRDLPDRPLPLDVFEFVCNLPHGIFEALHTRDQPEDVVYADLEPFVRWREAIRPAATRLEEILGSWVYYFADLDCETDDDGAHRFLALHMLASLLPGCPFVRYLLEASGAGSVDELLTALVDPASYTLPFLSWDAFSRPGPSALRIDYGTL